MMTCENSKRGHVCRDKECVRGCVCVRWYRPSVRTSFLLFLVVVCGVLLSSSSSTSIGQSSYGPCEQTMQQAHGRRTHSKKQVEETGSEASRKEGKKAFTYRALPKASHAI